MHGDADIGFIESDRSVGWVDYVDYSVRRGSGGVTDNDPGIDRIDDVHHGVSEGVNRVSSIAWVDDVNGRVGISACDNVSGVTRVG